MSLLSYLLATTGGIYNPLQLSLPPIFWFNPSGISGANGADMTTWTDAGPNSLVPAATGGAGNRPTVATNSLNGRTTAATANLQGLQIPSSPGVSYTSKDTWSLFAVVKWTAVGASENNFATLDNGLGAGFRTGLDHSTGNYLLVYPNVGNFLSGNSPTLNVFHCVVLTANAGVLSVSIDGTAYSLGTHIMAATSNPASFNLCMGFNFGGYLFQGNLADIAFYNGTLTGTDLSKLHIYSQITYGTP